MRMPISINNIGTNLRGFVSSQNRNRRRSLARCRWHYQCLKPGTRIIKGSDFTVHRKLRAIELFHNIRMSTGMSGKISLLLRVACPLHTFSRELNCNTAAITKVHRKIYERMYPTLLIQPDGSSINIKYHEPRQIIKLPLNLATLSEAQRKARIEARKPKTVIKIEDEIDDGFDAGKYLKFIKK